MEIYILSVLLGLVIGSFLNVVIFRTEKNKSFGGRSHCPKCKKTIPWHDNIPLLSYLLLGGCCRFCRKKISIQYPLVEMLTALVFLGATFLVVGTSRMSPLLNNWLAHYSNVVGLLTSFTKFGLNYPLVSADTGLKFFELIFLWTILSVLIVILVYDLKHMLIPDSFTLTGIIAVTLYNIIADILLLVAAIIPKNQLLILEVAGLAKKYQLPGLLPINLSSFLGWEPETFYTKMVHLKSYFPSLNVVSDTGASFVDRPLQFAISLLTDTRAGSGILAGLAVALIFFLIVYLSKETWMGMGDVKLVFFLGIFLGIFKTTVALFLAFELGAILGIILILFGRAKMKTALPFGPFLIVGAILSLLFI